MQLILIDLAAAIHMATRAVSVTKIPTLASKAAYNHLFHLSKNCPFKAAICRRAKAASDPTLHP
jgi:hypothetical protein